MGDKQPQATSVLVKRLRRVAKALDALANVAENNEVKAMWTARANTCWQCCGRIDELIDDLEALEANRGPQWT